MAGKKKIFKISLYVLLAAFVVIQFFRIDKTNPPIEQSKDFLTVTQAPNDVANVMKAACYDCHSNESKYPWYTNIAPVSWFIGDHIEHARKHLNFSIWGEYSEKRQMHKLEEAAEEVEEKEMPLESYVIMHSEADLSDNQRELLEDWFNSLRK